MLGRNSRTGPSWTQPAGGSTGPDENSPAEPQVRLAEDLDGPCPPIPQNSSFVCASLCFFDTGPVLVKTQNMKINTSDFLSRDDAEPMMKS